MAEQRSWTLQERFNHITKIDIGGKIYWYGRVYYDDDTIEQQHRCQYFDQLSGPPLSTDRCNIPQKIHFVIDVPGQEVAYLTENPTTDPIGDDDAGEVKRAAKEDHSHLHGIQPGGNNHALASTTSPGFMSPAEKSIIQSFTTTGVMFQEQVVLSSDDIINKTLEMTYTPIGLVNLTVIGGILQLQNVDFTVTGKIISWNSLALEMLVDEGSTIFLQYLKTGV